MKNEIEYAKVSKELLRFRELEAQLHPLSEALWQYDSNIDFESEEDKIIRLDLMDKISHIVASAFLDPIPYRDRD
jgi:hypothetical protein